MKIFNRRDTNVTGTHSIIGYFYILFFLLCLSFIIFSDIRKLVALLPDDSSYYFKIADNFVQGKGLTFDGIHRTNGFQPLWLYILVIVNYFIHGTPEMMVRVYLIVQLLLLMGATYLLYLALKNFISIKSLLLGSFFYLAYVIIYSLNGMESALLVFTISLLLYSWLSILKLNPDNKLHQFLLGIEIGLVLLVRLDTIFFAVGLFVGLLLFQFKWPELAIRLSLMSLGTLIVITPYLLYNQFSFGNIMPISGALKTSFPVISNYKINIFYGFSINMIAFAALGYLLYLISKKLFFKHPLDIFQIFLFALSMGIVFHYLNYIFFMKWAVYSWHFITYYLYLSILLSLWADRLIKRKVNSQLIYNTILVLAAVILAVRLVGKTQVNINHSFPVASYEAAKFMRENSAPEEIFAMTDAGVFGYFSNRQVINLDGIVNSVEYQKVLRSQKINSYFEELGVDYFIQHRMLDREEAEDVIAGNYEFLSISIYSHLYSTFSDEIVLSKENEVFRFPYYEGTRYTVYLIWKIDHDNIN